MQSLIGFDICFTFSASDFNFNMKVSIHTATHIDTRLAIVRVSRVRVRVS